jgi:hypothetical protein
VAAIAAAVINFGNFAFTSLVQPNAKTYRMDVQATLAQATVSADGRSATVPIKLTFTNTGDAGLRVLASTYTVVGRRVTYTTAPKTQKQINLAIGSHLPATDRTFINGFVPLQTDEFIRPTTAFEARDTVTIERSVDLTLPLAFDALQVSASVLVVAEENSPPTADMIPDYSWSMTDGSHVDDPPSCIGPSDTDFVRYTTAIREISFLRTLMRNKQVVVAWRILATPSQSAPEGALLYGAVVTDPADYCPQVQGDAPATAERYGLAASESGQIEKSGLELGLIQARPMKADTQTAHP